MQAVLVERCGGPEVLALVERPDLSPAADEILVEVKAAGVNPVDTYLRAGAEGYQPRLPYIPGMDGAGIVAAVGSGVATVRSGDRVYLAGSLSGTYAEFCLCNESQVFALPERLSFAQGAALGIPYATAYRALFQRGAVGKDDRVLIHGGSGGVGLASLQLCRARGIAVAATAGSAAGRAMLLTQGATAAFDHHAADYLDELQRWTGARGFDVIVEMLANVNLGKDLGLLATGGRVVVVGSRGTVAINPRLTMARDSSILGFSMLNLAPEQKREIHAALAPLLGDGLLQPVVRATLPLAAADQAHIAVLQTGAAGKIVLVTEAGGT